MEQYLTNDRCTIKYVDTDPRAGEGKSILILLHGFSGSSTVFRKNIPALSKVYRVIAPDLRGHGASDKPKHGYHVSRLAMDLRELFEHLDLIPNHASPSSTTDAQTPDPAATRKISAIGTSLGSSILWCYASLFTSSLFSHLIFVDQAPLQNSTTDGWDSRFCNRGMNNPWAIAGLQKTLELDPRAAHRGTAEACLGYRFAPREEDGEERRENGKEWIEDEEFFVGEAMKADGRWLGKLMEDHTGLDWRDTIRATLSTTSGSTTQILVIASDRSGCFPAAGPLKVVELVNGDAKGEGEGEGLARGVVVEWGGHWCYWEDREKFDGLVLGFLGGKE